MSEVSTELAGTGSIPQREMAPLVKEEKPENPVLAGIANLSIIKQMGLMFGLAASIALGISIVFWSQGPELRPLGTYTDKELLSLIEYLETNGVVYELERGGTVLVPKENFETLRLNVINEGIASESEPEDEVLAKDTGFGVSDKLESARLLRGKEKGLAKTIEQFSGVNAAEVHLAIPRSGVFVRDKRKPRASVLLNVKSYNALSEEQAYSIAELVASSVPELDVANVTLTDQFGRQLHSGTMGALDSHTSRQFKAEQKRQMELKSRIEEVLGPLIGLGKYTVQVNVDMDFTARENTQKTHNSDLPSVRSERVIDDYTTQSGVQGVPGALSNQPPQEAEIPQTLQQGGTELEGESQGGNRRLERERNYDLDTMVSHVKKQAGTIQRITVAIGLDYIDNPEAKSKTKPVQDAVDDEKPAEEPTEGEQPQENQAEQQEAANAEEPAEVDANAAEEAAQVAEVEEDIPPKISRTRDEIENIRRLVQGIIGFMPQRGDVVEIVSFPFAGVDVPAAPPPLAFYETPLFEKMQKPVVALLTILFLIFGLLRPIMKILATTAVEESELTVADTLPAGGIQLEEPEHSPDEVTISHDFGALGLPEPALESAAIVKQSQTIAMDNSHLVAQVIRNWMEEDA